MENKRIVFWDNSKYLLILLVVIGHFCDSLTKTGLLYQGIYIFIYSFHMPMFLFISGLFTKYDEKHKLKVDKILFYLALGYIFKLVLYVISLIGNSDVSWGWFRINTAPWYMFVLAGYLLLSFFIKKFNPVIVIAISVSFSLIAGYFSFISDFFSMSKFIVFFPFFYLGFCFKPSDVLIILNNRKVRIAGVIILIAVALSCIFFTEYAYAMRPVYASWHSYSEFPFSVKYAVLIRLFQYVSSFAIMIGVFSIIPRKICTN